jgi:hypothetical protein
MSGILDFRPKPVQLFVVNLVCQLSADDFLHRQLDTERRTRELLEAVAARSQVHLVIGGDGTEL